MRRSLALLLLAAAAVAVAAGDEGVRGQLGAAWARLDQATTAAPLARAEPSGVVERLTPTVAAASAQLRNASERPAPPAAAPSALDEPERAEQPSELDGEDEDDGAFNLKHLDNAELNAALLEDSDPDVPEDPAPEGAPDADADTKLVSIAEEAWIFTEPRWRSRKLGYLRAGAMVARDPEPAGNRGCKGGWYRVYPRGYMCIGKTASLDLSHPIAQLSRRRPSAEGLPYPYVTSRYPTPPLYARLPSVEQQEKIEHRRGHYLRQHRQLQRSTGYIAPPPAEPIPDWLAQGKVLPGLGGAYRGSKRVSLGRARVRSGFALLANYEHEGRRFGLTTGLALLPLDRTRVVQPSALHGVLLSDEMSLPIAIVRSKHARRYEPHGGSGALALSGGYRWRAVLPLTGKHRSRGREVYYEVRDGSWVHRDSVAKISRFRRAPRWARRGKKWIDVSLLRQTLVAYEGTRPVFATIVSTGAGGIGDPEKTHATVQGTFLIHTKHTTVTMDGDEQGDEFDLRDVPYVQYFTEGYALHAAYWHDDFGTPRSHGCVNLAPKDAAWLFGWTDPQVPDGWHAALSLKKGTIVYVHP